MVPDRPDTLRTYLWSGTHDPVYFFRPRNARAFSTHFLYYDRSNYSGFYVCHTGFTIVDLLNDERDVFSIIALWCATANRQRHRTVSAAAAPHRNNSNRLDWHLLRTGDDAGDPHLLPPSSGPSCCGVGSSEIGSSRLVVITSCINFLQTGRISLLRVAENIMTCLP